MDWDEIEENQKRVRYHEAAHATAIFCLWDGAEIEFVAVGDPLTTLTPAVDDMITGGYVEHNSDTFPPISILCILAGAAYDHQHGHDYSDALLLAAQKKYEVIDEQYPSIASDLKKSREIASLCENDDFDASYELFIESWEHALEFVDLCESPIEDLAENHLALGGAPGEAVRQVLSRYEVVRKFRQS